LGYGSADQSGLNGAVGPAHGGGSHACDLTAAIGDLSTRERRRRWMPRLWSPTAVGQASLRVRPRTLPMGAGGETIRALCGATAPR